MLGERRGRTRRTVGYDHHRHSLGVEIFGDRQSLSGDIATAVSAAGCNHLNRLGLKRLGDEPFDERNVFLLILNIRHFTFGPDIFLHPFGGVKPGEYAALFERLLFSDKSRSVQVSATCRVYRK